MCLLPNSVLDMNSIEMDSNQTLIFASSLLEKYNSRSPHEEFSPIAMKLITKQIEKVDDIVLGSFQVKFLDILKLTHYTSFLSSFKVEVEQYKLQYFAIHNYVSFDLNRRVDKHELDTYHRTVAYLNRNLNLQKLDSKMVKQHV